MSNKIINKISNKMNNLALFINLLLITIYLNFGYKISLMKEMKINQLSWKTLRLVKNLLISQNILV